MVWNVTKRNLLPKIKRPEDWNTIEPEQLLRAGQIDQNRKTPTLALTEFIKLLL